MSSSSALIQAPPQSSPARAPAIRDRALPPTVQAALAPVSSVDEAQRFTRQLAHSHYENFSVVSILLPAHLRQDFCNVYAFCRTADDLGDELGDRDRSFEMLESLAERTHRCYADQADGALFVALSTTIRRHHIPIQPFLDLIDAFQQDQRMRRYETFEQLRAYCRRSADPVGRVVLYMCGYRDDRRQRLSDRICTALQLANFWQDVRRDLLELDRIYLPAESMRKFGISEQMLRERLAMDESRTARPPACDFPSFDRNYRDLIRAEVDRTEALFDDGEELLTMLDDSVRPQIALIGKGGRAILEAIRRADYDTLSHRPTLTKWTKGRLVFSTLVSSMLSRLALIRRGLR